MTIDINKLRRLAQAVISKMNALDPEFVSSVTPLAVLELLDRLEAAESEAIEQARLNGMGSEREAALMAKLKVAEKERDDVAQQLVQSEQGKRKISEECDTYRAIYNNWADKTEWVQQGFNEGTISTKYLGLHRADVMARLLDEAEKERQIDEGRIANLMADLNRVGHEIDALRAKIEQTEQQEPVWFIDERGEPKRYHKSKADYCKYGGLDLLYALPGAKGE